MTIPEAIKFCEGYLPECDTKKFVIEQLGYREKRKPIFDEFHSEICPKCGKYNVRESDGYYKNDYCAHCGQAIDWSEEVSND